MITSIFYTAVHAVDTLLAHDKITVTSHDGRNQALMRTNRYEFINQKYQPLYSQSRSIRYLASPGTWVPADQIQKHVFRRYLYPIENSVQKLIGQDLELKDLQLKFDRVEPSK